MSVSLSIEIRLNPIEWTFTLRQADPSVRSVDHSNYHLQASCLKTALCVDWLLHSEAVMSATEVVVAPAAPPLAHTWPGTSTTSMTVETTRSNFTISDQPGPTTVAAESQSEFADGGFIAWRVVFCCSVIYFWFCGGICMFKVTANMGQHGLMVRLQILGEVSHSQHEQKE